MKVEHPVTEAIHPGLDIVELMIFQGISERCSSERGLSAEDLNQKLYSCVPQDRHIHAIEARVYCENPIADFKPAPGIIQNVKFVEADWLRVETWVGPVFKWYTHLLTSAFKVETGTNVTSFFDALVCKLVVTGSTREEAIGRMHVALSDCKIQGPPTNMTYLRAICDSEIFQTGDYTTSLLASVPFIPRCILFIEKGVSFCLCLQQCCGYLERRIGHHNTGLSG